MSDYLDDYRRHGYAVVRGLFAADDIARLRAAFARIWDQGLTFRASYRHRNVCFQIDRDRNLGRILRMAQWPSYFDRDLEACRRDPRIHRILAPLIGDDLKQIINQLHWKPAGAAMAEFGYHQDARSRRPSAAYRDLARSYVQTGIAVDAHTSENGAMCVYPGSHRLGALAIAQTGRVMHSALDASALEAFGLAPGNLVDLLLEPGDFALWSPYLVHGSGANRAGGARRLYINGYVTAASCDRGEWAFRDGLPCRLGAPVLVHYEALHERPEPHFFDHAAGS